jgi:Protein of unknown function DUF115
MSSQGTLGRVQALRDGVSSCLYLGRWVLQRLSRGCGQIAARLPPGLPLDRQAAELLSRNERFRDLHRGRRCFVIGNGPSLSKQDLRPLADETTIVVNAFWKHPLVTHIVPTYYCLADPLLFDGSEVSRRFLSTASARIVQATIFVPLSGLADVVAGVLPKERTCFFKQSGSLADRFFRDIDFTRAVPGVQNVAQTGIELALFMGCSPIYLLGLDHDWLSHVGPDRHFYEGLAGLEDHGNVVKTLAEFGYRRNMESQLELWQAYENLSRIGAGLGCRIENATRGGFLDVFPRASYEEVVGVSMGPAPGRDLPPHPAVGR